MNTIHKNRKRGFTLLEIILVIAAIGILAAIVLVAINPNRQLAQVRNAERRSEINTIYKALEQYLIDKGSYPTGITTVVQDICNTGSQKSTDTLSPTTLCDNKADLRVLVPDYIAAIPTDPGGGTYRVVINTSNNRVSVYASNAELGQGIGINDRPWTPANINTALWLDAADASTITTVSGAVSEWRDKSGNGRHAVQVTAENRPVYTASGLNEKSVLTFNPANPSTMTLPPTALGGATEATLFWVQKSTNDPASDELSGGSFISMEFGIGEGGSNHIPWTDGVVYFQAFSLTRKTIGNLAQSLSSPRILAVESKNNLFNFLIDGTVGFTTATNTYSNPSTSKLIGTGTGSLAYNFSGYAAECIVMNTIPSTATRQQIEGYLAWKWGLTNNLPANHPYKWNGTEFGGVNITDTDAQTYIAAVETADGQSLENNTRLAIQNFIVGAKADGIWDAIKSSNILAGARTLNGALVPLKGTAPTNFNFVAGDYDRKTGLKGNGINKYLNSNRAANADPQNSHHMATYRTLSLSNGALMGNIQEPSWDILDTENGTLRTFSRGQTFTNTGITNVANITGFIGLSRPSSSVVLGRADSRASSVSATSVPPVNELITIFARNRLGIPQTFNESRLSFYSIGESLDLAKLDARVTALMNELTAAIP